MEGLLERLQGLGLGPSETEEQLEDEVREEAMEEEEAAIEAGEEEEEEADEVRFLHTEKRAICSGSLRQK